ncbi:hypothetical protein OEA41_006017 [Lepraria neglecta]|uniref:Uncharacterized protein n=1 Tax=Lepraria neglecta TaxID=209136 RepID=A0AAE0DMP5_9LECA|nr:hypothetical protein OEA41_006017 [Lepraria neglecta]
MATIQDNETQINVLKEKQRRMGTVISRGWQATSDLGTITIRPDGGNEDGSDDVASGPMIPWPISSKERALLEWFRVESRVLYEIEEGEKGEKTAIKKSYHSGEKTFVLRYMNVEDESGSTLVTFDTKNLQNDPINNPHVLVFEQLFRRNPHPRLLIDSPKSDLNHLNHHTLKNQTNPTLHYGTVKDYNWNKMIVIITGDDGIEYTSKTGYLRELGGST